MGSIPLPALAVQTPENPLDSYTKALSVKSMLGQQKTQELQQTALAQENQQRENALKDTAAINKALRDSGGDYAKFRENVKKPEYGVSAPGQLSLDSQLMAHQKAAYELDTTTLENATKKSAAAAAALQPLASLDPASFQAELPKIVNQAIVNGAITPDQAKEFLNVKNQDDFNTHLSMLKTVAQQTGEIAEKQSKGIAAWKEDPGTGTMVNVDKTSPDFGKHMPITNGIPVPEDLAKAIGAPELAGTVTTPKMLKEYKDVADAGNHYENFNGNLNLVDGKGKLLKVMGKSNTMFMMGGAGMGPGSGSGGGQGGAPALSDVPSNLRDSVQAVLEYRSPMPPQSRNNPINQATRQWVQKLDKTYDETSFPARNKILTEYTKDMSEGQLGAINTALGHLGELKDAAKALSTNDIPLLHSIAAKYNLATGGDATSTYQMILHRVAPELTSAYVKGGGGEGERGASQDDFDATKRGAQQINSNIDESAKLLRSKIGAKEKNWNTTFKPTRDADKFENRYLTDDAKKVLEELSPSKGSKVFSAQQIQQIAKDHNVSIEEATKQAKAAGYTVQ